MSAWFDRFQKTWASTGIIQDPSDAQANAGFAFLGQAPPTVELFNSIQQWGDKKDTYLYNQLASVFTWGGQTANETNPNTLRDAIIGKQRIVLTADTNYYVDIAGNDTTGTGAVGAPWRTIQFAYDYIVKRVDTAGFIVNIQLKSAGTYAQASFDTPIGKGFAVTGDKLNSKLYIIKNTSGTAIAVGQSTILSLQGVALEGTGGAPTIGSPGAMGLFVVRSAICFIDAVAFGVTTLSSMCASEGGVIWPAKNAATLIAYGSPGTGYSFAQSQSGGNIILNTIATTIQGTLAYTYSFINATFLGVVRVTGATFTGTTTGPKYLAQFNGVIDSGGVTGSNLPGTAGALQTGGQIN